MIPDADCWLKGGWGGVGWKAALIERRGLNQGGA